MFVNITEKPPWGSVIKAITYYLLLIVNYVKLDLELMMLVLFVTMNLRIYITFSVNPSLQNVLDRFRIVLVPYIGSANPSFCTKRIIWSFIQTMPFIKFIKLFYNNWKIIFVGLQKEPNTS